MTDTDGAHIFPPRADDQRIIDAIAAQGGPFGFGVDGDFRRALGLFLGLSNDKILATSVDDMWRLYLDSVGLVNAAEPFSFELASGVAAVDADQYTETDFQNNPEGISGGIRVDTDWLIDGTKNWINREDRVETHDVDPPWSITPGDWTNRQAISGGSVTWALGGLQWTPDGTRFMTLSSSVIQHVNVSTPFDNTTVTGLVNKFVTPSMNKFHFPADGLSAYVFLAGATKHITQYPLSSPFDVSTLNNIAAPFFDYSSDVSSVNCMTLSPDGTRVYATINNADDNLISWELTTPFDITSATNFKTGPIVTVLANMTDPRLIFFRPDNGDIHLYSHLKSGSANQRMKVFSPP
jgi:hypothetical protein